MSTFYNYLKDQISDKEIENLLTEPAFSLSFKDVKYSDK